MLIAAVAVTVLIDGRPVEGSGPAELVRGTITAPLEPYLNRLAALVEIGADRKTVRLVRGGATVVLTIGERLARVGPGLRTLPIAPYLRDGQAIIPLAAVARDLGVAVRYDARSGTVALDEPPAPPLVTMTPYAPQPPLRDPAPTFSPTAAETPRPIVTGIPQPRRTPVSVIPAITAPPSRPGAR